MVNYKEDPKKQETSISSINLLQRKESYGVFLEDNRKASLNTIQLVKDRNKKKKKKDDDEDYQPYKKQRRFGFEKEKPTKIIKKTAHKRKHYNRKKYDAVYTCPACRRPLASIKKGAKKLDLTKFAYTSKNKNLKSQRALTLDHYPPWAGRLRKLESRGASDQEMKDDYNDEDRLRALCKKCNESHKYEGTKKIDYESDDEEEGYMTDSEEPENEGFYSSFRYKKDDHDKSGGGAGISV